MDQLKPILEQCQKHLFWIVSGIAVLLGSVGYFMTNQTINTKYTEQKTKIDGLYNNLSKVRSSVSTHPNRFSEEKLQEKIDVLAEDVRKAWEKQYSFQKSLLVWPESIRKNSPRLVRELDSFRPIEMIEYDPAAENISTGIRSGYTNFFDRDMPRIASIIGVNWEGKASELSSSSAMTGGMGGAGYPGAGAGMGGMGAGYGGGYGGGDDGYGAGSGDGGYGDYGGMGSGMGMGMGPGMAPKRNENVVDWSVESQNELIQDIRLWQDDKPTVWDILYTQENMWILESLLNVIRETNLQPNGKPAKAKFQCAINQIQFIRIGRSALGKAGQITGGGGNAGGMGGMPGSGGYGSDPYGGYGSGQSGGSDPYGGYGGEDSYGTGGYGEEGTISRPDPAFHRYVGADFQPLTGDDLRTKMKSESPEDAYFAVAKRIPVRMRVKMKQLKIPQFLANCGSANLMLEVRQVRIGDTVAATSSGGGSGMGGYGGMGGSAPGAGGLGGMGGVGGMDEGYGSEGGYGGYGGLSTESAESKEDIDVEVYGLVYLYNPVDIKRLGLDQVTEDTELETTVPAETTETPAAGQPSTEQAAGQPNAQPGTGQGNGQQNGQPGAAQPNAGQPNGQPGAGQPGAGQPNAGQPTAGPPNAG
ncbi:MAG: hypothetical protein AAF483_16305, partial [Planctomycetota bacterium]